MNHRINREFLIALRVELVIERKELAEASGVSYSTIAQLEQGRRQRASTATIRKLAHALEVPPTSLILRPAFLLPEAFGGRTVVGV